VQNRGREAIALEKKKMALDPLNFFHPYRLSETAWWLEEYATAADAAQKTISMMPGSFHGYLAAAHAAAGLGDPATALRNLEHAIELGHATAERVLVTASAASVYFQLNMPEKASEMLDRLETLAENDYVAARMRLLAYVGSSDVDMLVHWLSATMEERPCSTPCWNILFLAKHRAFDGLRDHPEFRALLEGF
jgi:tetratricopeptide (TPR) repeat protein